MAIENHDLSELQDWLDNPNSENIAIFPELPEERSGNRIVLKMPISEGLSEIFSMHIPAGNPYDTTPTNADPAKDFSTAFISNTVNPVYPQESFYNEGIYNSATQTLYSTRSYLATIHFTEQLQTVEFSEVWKEAYAKVNTRLAELSQEYIDSSPDLNTGAPETIITPSYVKSIEEAANKFFQEGKTSANLSETNPIPPIKISYSEEKYNPAPTNFRSTTTVLNNQEETSALLLSYIKNPSQTVEDTAQKVFAQELPHLTENLVRQQICRQTLKDFEDRSPVFLTTAKDVKKAMEALPSKNSKVWATFTRGGKQQTVNITAESLNRAASFTTADKNDDISLYSATSPASDADKLMQTFGRVYLTDITDITYRGISIYAVNESELQQRLATKPIEIEIYKPSQKIKDTIIDKYQTIDKRAVKNISSIEGFEHIDTVLAVVGANTPVDDALRDASRAISAVSIKNHSLSELGNLIVSKELPPSIITHGYSCFASKEFANTLSFTQTKIDPQSIFKDKKEQTQSRAQQPLHNLVSTIQKSSQNNPSLQQTPIHEQKQNTDFNRE